MKQYKLHDRMREVRLERRISQKDMAEYMGVSSPTYSLWESGRNQPCPRDLFRIAERLGVTSDYLLGLSDIKGIGAAEKTEDGQRAEIIGEPIKQTAVVLDTSGLSISGAELQAVIQKAITDVINK